MALFGTTFCEDLTGGKPFRLGLMGGTFDPIHIGHLVAAEQAAQEACLDGVLFVPTGCPVFKRDTRVEQAVHRVAMCDLACASNNLFDVATLEVERLGDTYAVDTLRQLKDYVSSAVQICYIIGADAAALLPKWRSADEVAKLAHFVVLSRPGFEKGTQVVSRLLNEGFSAEAVDISAVPVSSGLIRQRVAQGRSVRYLVPDSVNDYILEQGLYGEDE